MLRNVNPTASPADFFGTFLVKKITGTFHHQLIPRSKVGVVVISLSIAKRFLLSKTIPSHMRVVFKTCTRSIFC